MPLCENMPSGRATKPGDVHTSMSGKTIQVSWMVLSTSSFIIKPGMLHLRHCLPTYLLSTYSVVKYFYVGAHCTEILIIMLN